MIAYGLNKGVSRKRRNTVVMFLSAVVLLLFFSSSASADEETRIRPSTPIVIPEGYHFHARSERLGQIVSTCDKNLDPDSCKGDVMEGIKQDPIFFSYVLGYAAVRLNDISQCNKLIPHDITCRATFEQLMEGRILAEKKCNDLPAKVQPFCLNIDDCDNQSDEDMQVMCRGFKLGDVSLIMEAVGRRVSKKDNSTDTVQEMRIIEEVGVYKGFKHHGNKSICEKYASGLEGQRAYLCEVIFGKSSAEDVLDNVAEGLAYFLLSEHYNDKSLCEKIKNSNLNTACFSSGRSKYLEDYF